MPTARSFMMVKGCGSASTTAPCVAVDRKGGSYAAGGRGATLGGRGGRHPLDLGGREGRPAPPKGGGDAPPTRCGRKGEGLPWPTKGGEGGEEEGPRRCSKETLFSTEEGEGEEERGRVSESKKL